MPALPNLPDPAADAQLEAYYAQLDDLTEQALAGQVREDVFRQEMRRITEAAILLMFLLAGGDQNAPSADLALDEQYRIARNSVERLAEDIYDGRYSGRGESQAVLGRPAQTAEEAREKLRNRLVLWVFSLAGIDAIGKMHAAPMLIAGEYREPTYVWELGPTKEHCTDCLYLSGTVLTASEWIQTGVAPQSPDLECNGFRCMCSLVPTEAESLGFENQ